MFSFSIVPLSHGRFRVVVVRPDGLTASTNCESRVELNNFIQRYTNECLAEGKANV